ncbi:TetR/AcrR family transcriptional regulator [Aquisalibacillus elongatus]|uniref:TetR family transcriptional regulator n=1 Tax=Aquisalibacillus elongatus TaxID=485577 RepID=A0A3N5B9I1_9BACI|nr:TetR/AcrR family transcriptional regulator [Aquisalibacillus elongatus]RPF54134.1 TetR family transcriptional regulator [Aquisalibacillus elongatus]
MQDKKQQIIESSIKLFAKKGFHSTSVQQIVNEANVAKGSFYNYFESKEDLMVSIYDYYFVTIMEKMNEAKVESNPRKVLIKQLDIYFQFLVDHKPFLIMLLRDQVPLVDDVESFIIQMRQQNFDWSKENILAVYGEDIRPYENDAAVMLEGIIHSYSSWLVVDAETLDLDVLPRFIVNRLDDVCYGMMKNQDKTAIRDLPQVFRHHDLLISKIRQIIQGAISEEKDKALEALDVIEQEVTKKEPQSIIIDSMIEHLKKFDAIYNEVLTLEKTLERDDS